MLKPEGGSQAPARGRRRLRRRTLALVPLLAATALGMLHRRVEQRAHRPVPAPGSGDVDEADSLYFAYGSNMATRYLVNVRGVRPVHSEPAVVANHAVWFLGPGLSPLEPAFASLVKARNRSAHGVLHRVRRADLGRVRDSEGPLYTWVSLPVRTGDGKVVTAHSLLRRTAGAPGPPSRRYLRLLLEGATEHGLPAARVNELKATPSVHVPVASELVGSLLQAVVMQRAGTFSDGTAPERAAEAGHRRQTHGAAGRQEQQGLQQQQEDAEGGEEGDPDLRLDQQKQEQGHGGLQPQDRRGREGAGRLEEQHGSRSVLRILAPVPIDGDAAAHSGSAS